MTARQIEAARVAMTRFIKRGGKIWVRVFPDKPITKKPQETRMGKGKGAPEQWVCVVRPGRIMFEMEGVSETDARRAMQLAAAKLPIKTKFATRFGAGEGVMKAGGSSRAERRRAARAREGARRSAVPAAHSEVDGAARGAGQGARRAPRPGPDQDDPAREGLTTLALTRDEAMSVKAQLTGTVVSDKMDKTVVVAVERQVRHERLRQDPAQDVQVRRAQREQRSQGRRHRGHRRVASAQPPQAVGRDARRRRRPSGYSCRSDRSGGQP